MSGEIGNRTYMYAAFTIGLLSTIKRLHITKVVPMNVIVVSLWTSGMIY